MATTAAESTGATAGEDAELITGGIGVVGNGKEGEAPADPAVVEVANAIAAVVDGSNGTAPAVGLAAIAPNVDAAVVENAAAAGVVVVQPANAELSAHDKARLHAHGVSIEAAAVNVDLSAHEKARLYALTNTERKQPKKPKKAKPTPDTALLDMSVLYDQPPKKRGRKRKESLGENGAPKGKGRPKGSKDKKQRKSATPQKVEMPKSQAKKVAAAKQKIDEATQRQEASKDLLLKAEKAKGRSEKKLEAARQELKEADDYFNKIMDSVANDLLLEPTKWNQYYKKLYAFYEREGHTRITRNRPDVGKTKQDPVDMTVTGTSPEEQAMALQESGAMDAEAPVASGDQALVGPTKEEKSQLGWWSGRQRAAKREGSLEPYQELLLDRIGFNWAPPQGPTGEKWAIQYEDLKKFKAENGHTKVPRTYKPNQKLAWWCKSQISHYRNGQKGIKPALAPDRIKLLEEIGFDWGEPTVRTSWEDRFDELCKYKEEHGHVNVPWRWSENIPLAGWVNQQRNKYKEQADGKTNNLTKDQIETLEGVGFQWNTGGKGRYER